MEARGSVLKNENDIKAGFIGKYSFLITFILAFIVIVLGMGMAGMLPGGKYQAFLTDTMDQMTSMQLMLARHITRGDSVFYSWETSFGQNTSLLYAFCAYSPFTLLFIIIPDVYTATVIGMILKIAFSAAFFHLFLQYGLGKKIKEIVLFSLCYGLCGFQFEYMLSSNLMDALYLLPLVMLALSYAIRRKRFVPLILAYSFSFIIQFYCGFVIGIFSTLALTGILFIRDGKDFLKKNISFLGRFALAALTAVLISMILLMPAIMFFVSGTGFNSVMELNKIKPWDLLYAFCFGRPTGLMTDIPFLYCGISVVLLLPVYFWDKEYKLREKAVMLLALISLPVSLYVDPVYLLLHAFNRPDGFTARYAFVYVFLFVTLAVRAYVRLEKKENHKGRVAVYFLIMFIITLIVLLLHINYGEDAEGKGITFALYGNLILFPLWFFMFILRKKSVRWGLFLQGILLVSELTAQAYYNCREQGLTGSDIVKSWDEQTKQFASEMKKDPGKEWNIYRAHLGNPPDSNRSALYGYMGIGQFASSNYVALQSLMSRLGDKVSSMSYTQEGATDATDMLFGVRYRGYLTRADDNSRDKGPGYEVYRRALPIAYMVSADVLNIESFDANPFENQNRLVSALCGEKIQAYTEAEVWAHDEQNAEFLETENGYELRTVAGDVYGELLIGIPESGYEHAYIYLQLLPYEEETGERKLDEDMASDVAMYSTADRKASGARFGSDMGNAIMEMTEDGNAFIVKIADFENADKCYRYTEQYLYYQEEEELDKAYDILSKSTFKAESIKAGYIKGRITATEDMPILFTTIPYDKGWSILVDGKSVSPLAVVKDAFTAVYMAPGEHEIVLEFEPEGKMMGMILFCVGLIMFLLQLLSEYRSKSMNTE